MLETRGAYISGRQLGVEGGVVVGGRAEEGRVLRVDVALGQSLLELAARHELRRILHAEFPLNTVEEFLRVGADLRARAAAQEGFDFFPVAAVDLEAC